MIASAVLVAGASVAITAAQTPAPQTPTRPAEQPGQTQERQDRQERTAGNAVTDAWITMKIHSQFIPEDALEDSDIDVDTNAGVVTLAGTVATAAGRQRAVQIAKTTDGVKNVQDNLKVAPDVDRAAATGDRDTAQAARAGGRRVNDGWIKSKVYAEFLTENALHESDIDVDVNGGNVTLNGTVASEAAKSRAVALAKGIEGVKNVTDSLKIARQ